MKLGKPLVVLGLAIWLGLLDITVLLEFAIAILLWAMIVNSMVV